MKNKKNAGPPIEVVLPHHGFFWWVLVGCWWRPMLWIYFSFKVNLGGANIKIVHPPVEKQRFLRMGLI